MKQIQGLIQAMIAIGHFTSGHISTFVSDLTAPVRDQVLQQFTHSLGSLYSNKDVCTWLGEHVSLLGRHVFRLSDYLCQHPVDITYTVLQISRVCHLPDNLGEFVDICKLLNGTDKLTWFTEHLAECKLIQKVTYDDFVRLVLDLTQIRYANALSVHRQKITCQPMTRWLEVIEDLVFKSSALVTDQL